jgi:hypothetical protein
MTLFTPTREARAARRARRRARSTDSQLATVLAIFWLTMGTCAALLFVWTLQYREITVYADAEDNCPDYNGAYELSRVEGYNDAKGVHYVACVYR